ncbi:MAG: NfeD family protein [Verrucomicrobiota bacterium]
MTWDVIRDWFPPPVIWGLVGLILMILEMIVPGLFLFFFGLGAFVTAAVCLFFEPSLNIQLLVFICTSVISLFLLRRTMQQIFSGKWATSDMPDQLEEFVGKRAVVLESIDPIRGGKVELNGTPWKAKAEEPIEAGVIVEVLRHDNITLTVKPVQTNASSET